MILPKARITVSIDYLAPLSMLLASKYLARDVEKVKGIVGEMQGLRGQLLNIGMYLHDSPTMDKLITATHSYISMHAALFRCIDPVRILLLSA